MQVENAEHIFEAHTIQRMELLVLSTLEWQMSSVTPFSYIDYYFHKLGISNTLLRALLSRVSEIILATVRGVCGFWQTVRVPSTLLAIVINIVILCSIFHGCECHANDKNWKFQVFVCTVTLTTVFLNVCRNNVSCISTLSDSCCSYNLFPWRSHSPTSCWSA